MDPGIETKTSVVDAEDATAAFEKAVRVLNAAAQTRNGLNVKLRRAGYSRRAADEACRRAEALGYVDDRAYAEALVVKRLRQGRGRMLISRELGHKGLDDSLVGQAIGEVDVADELRSAVDLAARLLRRYAAEPDARRRQKVLAALARRGFSGRVSHEAYSRAGSQEGLSS